MITSFRGWLAHILSVQPFAKNCVIADQNAAGETDNQGDKYGQHYFARGFVIGVHAFSPCKYSSRARVMISSARKAA